MISSVEIRVAYSVDVPEGVEAAEDFQTQSFLFLRPDKIAQIKKEDKGLVGAIVRALAKPPNIEVSDTSQYS